MDEIVEHLKASLQDDFFSKLERKSLRELIAGNPLDEHQFNFLRSKIYELASEKANPSNYGFVLE